MNSLPTRDELRAGGAARSIDASRCQPEKADELWVPTDRKEFDLLQVLDPAHLPRPDGQSPRCSGFARAYNVTVSAQFPLGGPVIDRAGRILGVAISWRARGWLLVVPAAVARSVVE